MIPAYLLEHTSIFLKYNWISSKDYLHVYWRTPARLRESVCKSMGVHLHSSRLYLHISWSTPAHLLEYTCTCIGVYLHIYWVLLLFGLPVYGCTSACPLEYICLCSGVHLHISWSIQAHVLENMGKSMRVYQLTYLVLPEVFLGFVCI